MRKPLAKPLNPHKLIDLYASNNNKAGLSTQEKAQLVLILQGYERAYASQLQQAVCFVRAWDKHYPYSDLLIHLQAMNPLFNAGAHAHP